MARRRKKRAAGSRQRAATDFRQVLLDVRSGRLAATDFRQVLLSACRPLPTARRLLPAARRLLPAAYCPLPPAPGGSRPICRSSIFMSSQVSFFAAGLRSKYAGWYVQTTGIPRYS